MSNSFDVSADSSASVDQVYAAFVNKDYWLARNAALGGSKALDSLIVGSDGTLTVTVVEDLRRGVLPGILAKLYRGDLNIRSTERWKRAGSAQLDGEISVAVTGAPGSGRAAAVVAPSGSGSQLRLTGTVEFKVPLVGGKIESYIAREFAQGLPEIHRFTTGWISQNV
jgi:hypothetical protein